MEVHPWSYPCFRVCKTGPQNLVTGIHTRNKSKFILLNDSNLCSRRLQWVPPFPFSEIQVYLFLLPIGFRKLPFFPRRFFKFYKERALLSVLLWNLKQSSKIEGMPNGVLKSEQELIITLQKSAGLMCSTAVVARTRRKRPKKGKEIIFHDLPVDFSGPKIPLAPFDPSSYVLQFSK